MGQIVMELLRLTAAVYIVLVFMRTASQLAKNRAPAVSHALEFALGK